MPDVTTIKEASILWGVGERRITALCREGKSIPFIFSGLNNLKINSVMDRKYSEYFGFTADEVKEMAVYYKASGKYKEICEWYDG